MDNKYKAGWYCQIIRLIPEMVYKYIGSRNEPDDSLNVVLILEIGCNCKDTYPYLVHVLPFLPLLSQSLVMMSGLPCLYRLPVLWAGWIPPLFPSSHLLLFSP